MNDLNSKFDITDINTYDHAPLIGRHGLYSRMPIFSQQLIDNRNNPNIIKAFEIIYGHNKIVPSHDRVGFMRPTRSKNRAPRPEWENAFYYPGLHIDLDLVGYYSEHDRIIRQLNEFTYDDPRDFIRENNIRTNAMGTQAQGVLNIFSNRHEDGGFHCIPGAHLKLDNWWSLRQESVYDNPTGGLYTFDINNPVDKILVQEPAQRVPCAAGSLILFDCKMPHGTFPNKSDRPRLAQFIRMVSTEIFDKKTMSNRNKALKKQMKLCGYEAK